LCQASKKVDELKNAYITNYFYKGDLEADVRKMYKENSKISLEEVRNAVNNNLREAIIELSDYKQIINNMAQELADEPNQHIVSNYFCYYFQDSVDSKLKKDCSVYLQPIFKRVVEQK